MEEAENDPKCAVCKHTKSELIKCSKLSEEHIMCNVKLSFGSITFCNWCRFHLKKYFKKFIEEEYKNLFEDRDKLEKIRKIVNE